MASTLPRAEEWGRLAPRPGAVAYERGGDPRLLLASGYALLLQVAHPTVGAGVSEHSRFHEDPWGRLLRTLDYSYTMVFGGPRAAAEMGRRIRAGHRQIRGRRPDGARYHALEAEPYAWVHATLAEAIVCGHERFGRALEPAERERFWSEWRALGRLLGIGGQELPDEWAGFRFYFERMVAGTLELTPAVEEVLAALAAPPPPDVLLLRGAGWVPLRAPLGHVLALATVGLLPNALRERFGVGFTRAQELELRALCAAVRGATPLMPPWLRNAGPAYLRWRAPALAAAAAQQPRARNGGPPATAAGPDH